MPRTLDLPEPLSKELEVGAWEGVSPTDRATLLLYIATALHDSGKTITPFQEAVNVFLSDHSLDTDLVRTVLNELVRVCLVTPTGVGKTAAALEIAAQGRYKLVPDNRVYQTLLQWRNAIVHHPIDVGVHEVASPNAPFEELTQAKGRLQREATPKTAETNESPEAWTQAFEKWVASHQDIASVVVDDSREIIYDDGDRG